jgi:hypothetical protein
LPATGTVVDVAAALPFQVPQYVNEPSFLTGAADQVSLTYKMFGGDVLDLEITANQVYTAYELATLEYSMIINNHQARNVLADLLGFPTGTFDQDGEMKSGSVLSSSLSGASAATFYPSFDLQSMFNINRAVSQQANVGGTRTVYSASVAVTPGQPDYDLQASVEAQSLLSGYLFSGKVKDERITIRRVFYKTPRAMWRFYGYYGGLNAVGNLSSYGQYSDDSTFEVIPTWQNKLQAMAYEDNIWTRISHYSYEIRNNKLRIFPSPATSDIQFIWFEFTIEDGDVFGLEEPGGSKNERAKGVNNLNTVPFANIPYCNINSMGKHWIRNYALAIAKDMLGQVRSKFSVVPIPGESVTLNGPALVDQAVTEKEKLKTELVEYLDKVSYNQITADRAQLVEDSDRIVQKVPNSIFVG